MRMLFDDGREFGQYLINDEVRHTFDETSFAGVQIESA